MGSIQCRSILVVQWGRRFKDRQIFIITTEVLLIKILVQSKYYWPLISYSFWVTYLCTLILNLSIYSTFTHSHPLSNEFLAGLPVWVKHHYKYYLFTKGKRKKLHYHYFGKLLATQQWHSPRFGALGGTASKLMVQACPPL